MEDRVNESLPLPESAPVPPDRAPPADPCWYKDAIVYQLHVKAFFDSNDDGIGDFKGLTSKLDYVRDLGVNTLWLLPFYPSPRRDDGYDIVTVLRSLPKSPSASAARYANTAYAATFCASAFGSILSSVSSGVW